jgi:hypothetical protein
VILPSRISLSSLDSAIRHHLLSKRGYERDGVSSYVLLAG